jgi:ribonuclease HI
LAYRSHSKQRESEETIYFNFDGLCEPINPGGIATFGVVIRRGRVHLLEDSGLAFAEPWSDQASNNVAEYSALIRGLRWLKDHDMVESPIVVRGDSSLVINQLKGIFKVKAVRLLELYQEARKLFHEFPNIKIEWVDRNQNKEADLLSRLAYSKYRRKYPQPRKEQVKQSAALDK